MMMALSNKHGWLVLTTGNKSEMSVGYATLYGDMAGGFAAIKDVPKTLVYELVRHRNESAGRELIPASVLERAPSAELRPDQLDSDSLPPYELLDRMLESYVERDQGREEMIAAGLPADGRRRGRAAWSTAPSTSAARRRPVSASRRRPSAATGVCRSRTASAASPTSGPACTAIVICAKAQRRSSASLTSASQTQVVRPRWRALAWTSAWPSVIGRMKLTLIDWPIAIIPSPSTARAVAREQTLSIRLDITPPCRRPDRLAQLVAHRDPHAGVLGVVVEPLGAQQGVEMGEQSARILSHRAGPYPCA